MRWDAERFTLLQDIVEGRLHMILHGYNRRILFNVVRSVQPDELRWMLGAPDPEREMAAGVTAILTRAIIWFAQPQVAHRLPDGAGIRLTEDELTQLSGLPEQLARLFALSVLTHNAEAAFRGASKGLQLKLDQIGRPAEPEITSVDNERGWAWEPDPELMTAMAEYDARRRRTDATVTGLPATQALQRGGVFWLAAGIYDLPLTVTYANGQEHTTRHFMVRPVDISARLKHLAALDAQFAVTFGLSVEAFGRICQSLAGSVFRLAALEELELRPMHGGRQRTRSRLRTDDPRLDSAPTYLHEVLSEGSLRASRSDWSDTLSKAYYDNHKSASPAAIDTFLKVFTSSAARNDPRLLQPALFHELERNTLVLDLARAKDFVDLCFYALITHSDRADPDSMKGRTRGKRFETYAREVLCTRLGLTPPFPVDPGYKLAKAGLSDGEVDFCFLRDTVLVHIDMKAWRRNIDYHRGVHQAVRNRVDNVTRQLRKQVEPRGEELRRLLQERGLRIDTVVNLLCVADAEYIPPGPKLRYGGIPRVLTAEEIADLILNRSRWKTVLRAAHASMA
jgi:hypothetical protein